jgi:hypothetical protein
VLARRSLSAPKVEKIATVQSQATLHRPRDLSLHKLSVPANPFATKGFVRSPCASGPRNGPRIRHTFESQDTWIETEELGR